MSQQINLGALERIVRHDPGNRGVASYCLGGALLGEGELERAVEQFAAEARSVAIVTGFCVHDGRQWVAETDGPPGALYLARACLALGIETTLLSDRYGVPALNAGCAAWGLPPEIVVEAPLEDERPSADASMDCSETDELATPNIDAWSRAFLDSPVGRRLTHLVSIERVGPSHTHDSLAATTDANPGALARFDEAVPGQDRNRCHNMRGVVIDAHTARLHRLFELAGQQSWPITTIGMADGGNELGMGKFGWDVLRQAIRQGPTERVICRVDADFTLLAGVSNWAAYAFAAAVAARRGRRELVTAWGAASQRELIESLVEHSSVVDGVTKLHEPTVDGLPLDDYLSVLTQVQQSIIEVR